MMTEEQIRHMEGLVRNFGRMLRSKYNRGVEEHGGNLWDLPALQLIDEAILENIDQFTYLMTARQKIAEAEARIIGANNDPSGHPQGQ